MKIERGTLPIILLVDDDPNDQELAKLALENSEIPHMLLIARDGVEALELLEKHVPQLTLLDLKLPRVIGLEVLEKIRANERTKFAPIVVFTSSVEEKDLERSYKLGANAYLRKPASFSEYKHLVADTGRFWILRNQAPPQTLAAGVPL